MRIGGLASGMDTESIVRQLMQVERQPLDRFLQRKQTLEWQRDAYREVNIKLRTLEQSAFSLRLTTAFNSRQATSSNPAAFTVTTTSSLRNGTYEFEVEQVATRTRNVSTGTISSDDRKLSTSAKLNTQTDALGANINSFHGEMFTIQTHDANGVAVERSFTVNTDESLNDLFKRINESDLGVRAFYDSTFDKVVFERKTTGAFETTEITVPGEGDSVQTRQMQIAFGGETGFLTNVLKINNTSEIAGQDARVKFSDPILGNIERTSRNNSITIGNMTFNVMQKTEGPERVTVTSNTDQAFNNIKGFVDKYNETIAEIQIMLSEPRHRGFPPLTDEQRRELSEREAELWDEKAKSGMLRGDPILSSVLNQMRQQLSSPVQNSGQFNHLSQIGITTSSNFRDGGMLVIDEKKLREALEQDPQSVHQLFNNTADSSLTSIPRGERTAEQRRQIESQSGFVARLRTTIDTEMNKIIQRAGNENRTSQQFVLGREMLSVDKQIDRFQRRLSDIESRYWAQFSRMEKAANQANSQGMALMQAFMNF